MTTVKEVMMTGAAAVGISTPAIEVAQRMKASGASTIPVCENGKIRGFITERDIAVDVVAASRDPNTTLAGFVMTKDWSTLSLPMTIYGTQLM